MSNVGPHQCHRCDAGWYLSDAVAINAHGWITGTAFNSLTNERRAYVLKPAWHRP